MVVMRQIVNKTISLLLPVNPEVHLPLLFTSSGRLLANRSDRRSDVWQLTSSGLGSVVRSAPSVPFGGLQLLLTGMGSPLLLLLLLRWPGLLAAEQVAVLEVLLEEQPGVSALLRGEVVESSGDGSEGGEREELEGNLVLVRVEEASEIAGEPEEQEPWIGLLPVDSTASRGGQESFADAVVNKMKRALVLGASALIILALNPNPVSEMDLSPVLSKPIIVVHTSENVTKLIGALLRGLRATAKITYQSILQDDLGGATLTLWSSCGRSRGGLYGEWQGVICTGESNSQVQKYLQQLWDTVLLVVLILCTGVILQARWQHQDRQPNDNFQFPKQDVLRSMSLLKTRPYRQPKRWCGPSQPTDADICAVCLEAFRNNQCLRVLPCLHEYHRDCVDPWLLLQHTCPLCKRSILGGVCKDG
ncbi:RING finger protein 215 isoform X1 [Oryzias latipes]|uniref:Ring finger protein 215 n=1 Tax=Oryzias latipes TaxID=8090 RepID=A0A3B3HAM6_ORYLA|nr:RING finger protein 215 isoform X1 [Oryzias latipes]